MLIVYTAKIGSDVLWLRVAAICVSSKTYKILYIEEAEVPV